MTRAIVDKYLKPENYKKDKTLAIVLLINLGCCALIVLSIFTAISANLVGGSLWVDEAMLAASVTKRSIWELTAQPLEMNQSAPVIYLYLVKVITLIFGNNEMTLRLWSLIAYILMLGSVYYILNRVLKVKFPLLSTAFVACLNIMILYSFEFKPYMTDCLMILVALIVYHLYDQKKIGAPILAISYMLCIWISNPVCFFIGGALLYNLMEAVRNKNYKQIRTIVLCGVLILISFVCYYFYWLKPVIDTGFMQDFWKAKNFSIYPFNSHTLYLQRILIDDILINLGIFRYLFFWIAVLGLFINLRWTNKIIYIIYLGFIITLAASMLGMFPIQERMCLFAYPLLLVLSHFFISRLYSKHTLANAAVLAVVIAIFLLSAGEFGKYMDSQNVYKEETNMAIKYIEKNIKDGEALYTMQVSTPGYLYYKRYKLEDIPYKLTMGDINDWRDTNEEDIRLVQNNAPMYILMSREKITTISFTYFDETLRKRGNMELRYQAPKAWVYYYTNKEDEDLKN